MKLQEIWNLMFLFCSASCNLYSSTVGLERMLQTEESIIEIYQSHVLKTEKQISELKRQIDTLKMEHEKSKVYISDPFNSFHLVKRILIDWSKVEKVLSDSLLKEAKQNITELKDSINFPTDQDLKGTADAINLISDTYNIEVTSLANGIVNGIQYPSQLSADDCYELGLNSFEENDFHHTYSWMDEALKRFHKEEYPRDAYVIENALEIKAYSAYQLGDLSSALKITTELLKHYPDNPNARGNIKYYKTMLNRKEVPEPTEMRKNLSDRDIKYSELCRKAIPLPIEISSQLKCHYIHNDVPFLRLAPIKEEEVSLNPRIVLFKNALYDSEIELLKELAKPQLETALVVNYVDGSDIFSKNRIGQLSWVKRQDHPRMRTILQRAEDMTKLDPSSSEDLQVVNYGVGGHYKPHLDSFEDYDMPLLEDGDRIATLLYYMNDVEQGGATVFIKLNVGVWPEKGSALLWYNLLPDSNKEDERSVHGACPVVAGTKWIGTIWFRSKGQELRRPCLLKR